MFLYNNNIRNFSYRFFKSLESWKDTNMEKNPKNNKNRKKQQEQKERIHKNETVEPLGGKSRE